MTIRANFNFNQNTIGFSEVMVKLTSLSKISLMVIHAYYNLSVRHEILKMIPIKQESITRTNINTHVFPTLEPTKPPTPSHSLMKSCLSLFNTHLKKTHPGKMGFGLTE